MSSTRIERAPRGAVWIGSALVALSVLCAAGPLHAQKGMSDADVKAMQSYQLTASGLSKYTRAVHNMIQVTKAHPEIAKEEDGSQANSLADIAAIYDRHPEVKRAITSAGMSSRDFVLFTIVLAQSGAAMSMQQANGGKLPPGIQPANVEFLKAHQAELMTLEQEMQQADSAAADTSGGGGR